MDERTCLACGVKLENATVRRKYCGDRCKRRYHRGARAGGRSEPKREERSGVRSVAAATLIELQEAARLHTALGQAALALAHRLDAGEGTDQGAASLAKQLQQTLEAATADVAVADDPLDELTRRREEKRRAATG